MEERWHVYDESTHLNRKVENVGPGHVKRSELRLLHSGVALGPHAHRCFKLDVGLELALVVIQLGLGQLDHLADDG